MRKEQEIFTQVNAQNVPVDADVLDTLEQEVMNESVLREYIRELLTEAAKKPRDLPAGVQIVIKSHGPKGAKIYYAEEDEEHIVATQDGPWGEMFIVDVTDRNDTGPCGGAWKVSSVNAGTGWGPMLYDVAMEYATVMGAGLIADRDSVSKDARAVWNYYLSRRGDVKVHQLDDMQNSLTPEEEDNCDQGVSLHTVKLADLDDSGNSLKWTESPLSKRYTKEMTTMNALIALDKLVEL
jgi:hypothetical protein